MKAAFERADRLLIVEDDADIREALADALQAEGYPVDVVTNGDEAFAWLRSHENPPSVIILDLMMPVKDGYAFRTEQKKHPAWADIPVLVLSASPEAGQSFEPTDRAVLLRKPVDLDDLLKTVERLAAEKQGEEREAIRPPPLVAGKERGGSRE